METEFNLEAFRLTGALPARPAVKRRKRKFLKGPVPLDWLEAAAAIPNRRAIVAGLVLWHLAGLSASRTGLVFCPNRCEDFGVSDRSGSRGLADLQKAGLVRIWRKRGACPRVDILMVAGDETN